MYSVQYSLLTRLSQDYVSNERSEKQRESKNTFKNREQFSYSFNISVFLARLSGIAGTRALCSAVLLAPVIRNPLRSEGLSLHG
jgi:hypothetical protein